MSRPDPPRLSVVRGGARPTRAPGIVDAAVPHADDTRAGRGVVLIVINDLVTGGAQRVALQQASWLSAAGWDARLVSLERLTRGPLAGEARAAGLPVHLLRTPHEPEALGVVRLDRLIGASRPVVVHTHLAIAGVVGRVCAWHHGVPRLMSTLHNLTDWEERSRDPLRLLDRRTLRWCDAVIASSEAIRTAMAHHDPALAARARVIHNGVDAAAFAGGDPAVRAATRARLGYPVDACVVGAVARLERRKGIDVLVTAFAGARAARPELRLLLVGDGPERAALGAAAAELGVAGDVRFAGDCGDVRPLLAAMDVFAAPSRTEGLGLALIEALAAGLPAVASHVGGIPEVVGDAGCAWLLPAGDVEQWSAALVRIAADPAARAAMSAAAPARARKFSIDASRDALTALYDEFAPPVRMAA